MMEWRYECYVPFPGEKANLLCYSFKKEFALLKDAEAYGNPILDWLLAACLEDEYTIVIREHHVKITEHRLGVVSERERFTYDIAPYYVLDIHFRSDNDAMLFKLSHLV